MPETLSGERSEEGFKDFKGAYTPVQAKVEAQRCLYCADAPCMHACPTRIDIPQFIRKIATDNAQGSAKTIFDSNILGMSCARVCPVEVLCVGACVYNAMGVPPIQIGKLQRYSTDKAFDQGWRFYEAGPASGKSIALIGGGPATLAAAHELRRFGHAVTIYEKRDVLGGLNTTGVAPYKMKADRSIEEVEWILAIGGIDVRTGISVGTDVGFPELEATHDAIFLGVGLGPDTPLGIPGEGLSGVWGAVSFIEHMKCGTVDLAGVSQCVVVGGGNTAIDAVRESLGLGVPSTVMVYRGTDRHMSGYLHEWRAAQTQGARAEWQALPVAFEGTHRVEAIRCVRVDDAKQPIPGSDFRIEAQLVLVAIGQSKLTAALSTLDGITLDRGRVITDAEGRTGRPKYYAGGDCRNGGKEVVNAAAEGKAAARAIHADLIGAV